jgi:hypothetical protein
MTSGMRNGKDRDCERFLEGDMKQIEIDCVKEFAEKMREFGYAVDIKVDERPTVDFAKPDYKTEITLECQKRIENNDAPPWDLFNLSFRLSSSKTSPAKINGI